MNNRPCRYCGSPVEYDQLLNLRSGQVAHIDCYRGTLSRVRPGTPCVCGHTVEQHGTPRCEALDVICGCVRFRVVVR